MASHGTSTALLRCRNTAIADIQLAHCNIVTMLQLCHCNIGTMLQCANCIGTILFPILLDIIKNVICQHKDTKK